jgi:hypothetical protein
LFSAVHPFTGKEMEYMARMKDPRLQPLWTRGFGNKCGHLFQGIRDRALMAKYKPRQEKRERVRLTVGGDRLDYSDDVATSMVDITTFKILINSTLSTEEAAMMMMDIKNFYLGTPLPRYKTSLPFLGPRLIHLTSSMT